MVNEIGAKFENFKPPAGADGGRPLIGQQKSYDSNLSTTRAAMPAEAVPPTAPPASFEAALSELETLVADLEGGQLPLAQALEAYRRGAQLLQYAQGQLQSAQEQVKILEGDLLRNFETAEGGADPA